MRLLIACGGRQLCASLCHTLSTPHFTIDTVADSESAIAYIESNAFDGIIIDTDLPGGSGLAVLKTARALNIATSALLLTAGSVSARVQALDAGADDCLTKSFAAVELLARVRAMLRRKDIYRPELLTACGLTLDRSTFTLCCEERRLALSAREYQIVEFMMAHPASIIASDRFLTHIWGWESNVGVNTLWVHISNIRKKLAALNAPCTIRFVRKAGYILESTRS